MKKLIGEEYFVPEEVPVEGEAGSDVPGYPELPLQFPLLNSTTTSKPRYTGTVARIMSLGGFKTKYPTEEDVGQVEDDRGQAIDYKAALKTKQSHHKTDEGNMKIPRDTEEDVFKEPSKAEQEDQEGPVNKKLPQGA